MKRLLLILAFFGTIHPVMAQLSKSLTIQYIPRIKEQSISVIYHTSEKMAFHGNLGYISGYNFLYTRTNDDEITLLTSKGSGVALRAAARRCYPSKNGKFEWYIEPVLMYKFYRFSDTSYSTIKNTNDTLFNTDVNGNITGFHFKNYYNGMERYTRNGVQLGLMYGVQIYLKNNFTLSANSGFSFRRQTYSSGYSNLGISLHLNAGIGYVLKGL